MPRAGPAAAGLCKAAGEPPAELSQNDVDSVIVNDGFVIGPGLAGRAPLRVEPGVVWMGSPVDAEELAFVEAGAGASASAGKGAAEPNERPALRLDAFADIDALELREKLKRLAWWRRAVPVSAAGLAAIAEFADGTAEVAAEASQSCGDAFGFGGSFGSRGKSCRPDPFHGRHKETHVRAHLRRRQSSPGQRVTERE